MNENIQGTFDFLDFLGKGRIYSRDSQYIRCDYMTILHTAFFGCTPHTNVRILRVVKFLLHRLSADQCQQVQMQYSYRVCVRVFTLAINVLYSHCDISFFTRPIKAINPRLRFLALCKIMQIFSLCNV